MTRPLRCGWHHRPGPHVMRRTGHSRLTGEGRLGRLNRQYEYVCTCGFTGVSASPDVLALHTLAESQQVTLGGG